MCWNRSGSMGRRNLWTSTGSLWAWPRRWANEKIISSSKICGVSFDWKLFTHLNLKQLRNAGNDALHHALIDWLEENESRKRADKESKSVCNFPPSIGLEWSALEETLWSGRNIFLSGRLLFLFGGICKRAKERRLHFRPVPSVLMDPQYQAPVQYYSTGRINSEPAQVPRRWNLVNSAIFFSNEVLAMLFKSFNDS